MGMLRTFRHSTVTAICTAIVLLVGYSIPLHAQSASQELLESLQEATPEQASRIDRNLRSEWSKSGSASMDLLLRRGRKALEDDDNSAALDHFTALTDHAPDFAEGWHGLARAYFEAELFGPSLDALGRAIALNPDHYHAIFGLGALLQRFEDYPRAATAYRTVLGLNPHHEEAKQALDSLKRHGIGQEL